MNVLLQSSQTESGKSCAGAKAMEGGLSHDVSGHHVTISARTSTRPDAYSEGTRIQADNGTVETTIDTLRVMVATPFGQYGRGGIDRLTDLIINSIDQRKELGVKAARLVTRGEKRWWPLVFARALVQFGIAAWRRDVDVVHLQLSWRAGVYRKLFIAAIARHLGIPYVVHLHSGRFGRFWTGSGAYVSRRIDRLFMESAAIIVLGQCWARLVVDRVPDVKGKIIVLPNATTVLDGPKRDRADGEPIQITFLGQVRPEKGVPQLIDALGKLSSRAGWSATIAGNGSLDQSRSHAQQLGISDRVDFPGWLGPHETAALLSRTDILVLPSFVENLPMVVIEGFAYGVAVIATPVGAVPEVIDHERNGLLVPVGDVGALAAALDRLIENGELRRSLGDAGRRDYAERYEIGAYIPRLVSAWRRAARS
ncbi:glycosyltransferase family 4 protein [Bradyrhizobium sp. UFLA05-109]